MDTKIIDEFFEGPIGCKEGIEREDLQKVLDTYNKFQWQKKRL